MRKRIQNRQINSEQEKKFQYGGYAVCPQTGVGSLADPLWPHHAIFPPQRTLIEW